MEGYLSKNQIDYVVFHLCLVFQVTDELRNRFVFSKDTNEVEAVPGSIVFKMSDKKLDVGNIKIIEGIPVLFPCGSSRRFWNSNKDILVFEDDLLKSAFYLLSGYQEYVHKTRDPLGRFSASDSIQHRLGIIDKPVVNYYFEQIRNGIRSYMSEQNRIIEGRKLFSPFCFLLTHDVDRIRLHSYNYLVYKLKEITGIRKSAVSRAILVKQFVNALTDYLFMNVEQDPAWNFDYLGTIEDNKGLRSVFYFLDNETRHVDADYKLNDPRIMELVEKLSGEHYEIGLHGSHNSATSKESMLKGLSHLKEIFPHEIKGIRQHRLRYEIPSTAIIQEQCGFVYDSSLGYYDYEGFRNSFCLPFRLYDFNRDVPVLIWEIPLNVMDCTLLEYRCLNMEESLVRIEGLLAEITRFSGVFTLLWHNGYFDEVRFPGIHRFYEKLISAISDKEPVNMTGFQIIDTIGSKL